MLRQPHSRPLSDECLKHLVQPAVGSDGSAAFGVFLAETMKHIVISLHLKVETRKRYCHPFDRLEIDGNICLSGHGTPLLGSVLVRGNLRVRSAHNVPSAPGPVLLNNEP